MLNRRHFGKFAVAAAVLTTATNFAAAQVDTVVSVVGKDYTVGVQQLDGSYAYGTLGSIGYMPPIGANPEVFYAAGFTNTNQDIRMIVPGAGGTFTVTRLVTNSPWQMFMKNGNTGFGGGVPTPYSLLINRVATGSLAAFSTAVIADAGGVVTDAGTRREDLTQKFYRFNLQLDTNGDARDEMTSLVTTAQMKVVAGLAPSSTASTNPGRQPAFSTDNSHFYFIDITTATAYGGLWKANTEFGANTPGGLTRPIIDGDISCEPAVISVGGHDRVYFNGSAASSNVGGIDYYDEADGQRKIALPAATLANFMEQAVGKTTVNACIADAQGNLYFNNSNTTAPERRGLYMMDPAGNLLKISSMQERQATFTTNNSSIVRMQWRDATYTGANGTFNIPQILYYEPSSNNAIGGINIFKPGDFNRDNAFTAADGLLFGQKLTPMSTTTLVSAVDAKFDLNGNNIVNYKDVRALQPFINFADGDSNFDLTVNFDDLLSLAQNYGATSGKTWYQGDFNGDDAVNFDDLLVLAQNYNAAPASVDGLGSSIAADWALALSLVPEPTSLAVVVGAGLLSSRRRRL